MDSVYGASKSELDFWGVNGGVNGGAGDDFFVDELLDFSSGFSETEEQVPLKPDEPQEMEQGRNKICPVFSSQENLGLSEKDDFVSLPETHGEGLESLEWLSHFVEDSFSDYSLTGRIPPPAKKMVEPAAPKPEEKPCFTTPVQTKTRTRTKRARTGVRVWPVLSPSSSTSSTSSSNLDFDQTGDSYAPNPVGPKKQRKKTAEGSGGGAPQPRRCGHCGVTKTPQWRAGPLGSKTLCNACGVRFKSGRLLPEYRPACSPTFSSELHSNNHRKVMEMRRKREGETENEN